MHRGCDKIILLVDRGLLFWYNEFKMQDTVVYEVDPSTKIMR